MEKFQMVAKTFQGLEEILAEELNQLGAENVEIGRRMVAFSGDKKLMYRANLCCRTALRILKPIFRFKASNTDELYDEVRDIKWETLLDTSKTFSIDSTVNSSEFTHSKFVTYRVKDGIVDHFKDLNNQRPSIRLQGADIQLNVHIFENEVTISLDSSGEPLSRRGYRTHQTEAPINEVLAAGIIMLTGWRGDTPFFDPMCGSGTFLIEAALIASNTNPGIFRSNFAFETWPDFDKELFEELYNDDSEERPIAHPIEGADIDPEAIRIARQNIKNAGMDHYIQLNCRDINDTPRAEQPEGILITNPPYGERLKPEAIETLYHNIGRILKNNFQGWHAWILGYKKEHFKEIGMKPSIKIPLLNGALECSLREYVMFDGKFADFRAAGGELGGTHSERNTDSPRQKEKPKRFKTNDRPLSDEFKSHDSRKSKAGFKKSKDCFGKQKGGYGKNRDEFRKSRGEFSNNKGFAKNTEDKRIAPAKIVNDRKPRLNADDATVFIPSQMRQRKGWRKKSDKTDTNE